MAAFFHSLIESAKLCHVEPRAYLKETTLRARPETRARSPSPATSSPWKPEKKNQAIDPVRGRFRENGRGLTMKLHSFRSRGG